MEQTTNHSASGATLQAFVRYHGDDLSYGSHLFTILIGVLNPVIKFLQ